MRDDLPPTEAELARLADGSLPPAQRDAVRHRIAGSAELTARAREQERAVALMRSTEGEAAPATLRATLAGLADQGGRRADADDAALGWMRTPARRRLVPVVAALAVIAVALFAGLRSSSPPTVDQTAHLALASATGPPPATDPSDRELLDLKVGDIAFPSYVGTRGWHATGARSDSLHGRRITIVFYRSAAGARVGYAIVAGAALAVPPGDSHTVGGVRYVLSTSNGPSHSVTWQRDGHTCVIAGAVPTNLLLELAAADEQTA